MRIWKYAVPVAGVALLLGASFAFGQQGSNSATQGQNQQSSTSATSAYFCPYANSGMYRGMAYGSGMGRMAWQGSGMRATFQKLQSTLNQAKSTTDPAKVKSLLNQAGQKLSQLMSHMRVGYMGNGNGMMMNGGMMMYRMGQQQGFMRNNSPATSPQQQ